MSRSQVDAVTGAFGYSGKYIARRLLDRGHQVRTLTDSPHRRNPFEAAVEVHPFHFDDPARLRASLEGVSVLYNTYWVRFNHKTFTHAAAVRNTTRLFDAARAAEHAESLGRRYASELARRRDRLSEYVESSAARKR